MAKAAAKPATDDALTAEQKFVTDGQARVAPALDGLNSLADRLGGQNGMVLHALHGSLVACFAALLNHIAGVPEPEAVPYVEEPAAPLAPIADPA